VHSHTADRQPLCNEPRGCGWLDGADEGARRAIRNGVHAQPGTHVRGCAAGHTARVIVVDVDTAVIDGAQGAAAASSIVPVLLLLVLLRKRAAPTERW
jgi:D-aminopeptidase